METLEASRSRQALIVRAARLAMVVLIGLHLLVSWFEPLPGEGNDYFFYILALLAAWLATLLCTLVWRQYRPAEPPGHVWGAFAMGLGAWAVAELVWLLLRPYYESFPEIFITDFFYLAGYFCFGVSIFLQYRLIMQPAPQQQRQILLLLAIGVPVAVVLLTFGLRAAGLGLEWSLPGMLLYACYPVGDALMGFSGLYLSHLFGRGLWGRAWWGLVAFALSDGFSFWYDMGGYTLLSEQADFYLSLAASTLYVLGYLVVALACLRQLLLLMPIAATLLDVPAGDPPSL